MLQVNDLTLLAGTFRLESICLNIAPGEYLVLMGPTGSGKSLLMKCLCRISSAGRGTIVIDGRDVTRLEPRARGIGYLPQESGLFPHINVAKNLTFPLRVRGIRHRRAMREVSPIIESLGIEPLLRRSPLNLSGGETQKVALGRALAARPKLLLLDEPMSALDEPTGREVCRLLRRVQQEFGVSTIHVCHSITEARAVSDRVAIIHAGRLCQTGTIDELFRKPRTQAVARLLGVEENCGP